ncbi:MULTISPECIES: DUF3105 domain-containing protein [Actinosynnema]|uniref:DUF3105 domain-containing protein n=1 Tax=Actinosynnema pretiosum TaxID=42197 RepID=A0A290ZDH9_9PSEU|nr:DUF3105 domain-containing protein [Actinosynnema pretiosum]ATE57055.1 hypothetical protein CNX65_30320 [Actinosynnema pretiosum]
MTSGKKTKAARSSVQAARSSVVASKPKPWGTIIAVIAVLGLAGGVFGYAYTRIDEKNQRDAALAKWNPTEENKDPSDQIEGVVKQEYAAGKHVDATQRVAYNFSPPFGGPHDSVWANCTGVVYSSAVRTENMVHGLEHGAVWIAYNPDQVSGPALDTLKAKVDNQPFTMMSPYPGLDKPISLQSWGHQLKLESADDERIDQFIQSLRRNQYTYPEIGATCDSATFNVDSPPPFVAEAPGADAVPMEGGTQATDEMPQDGQPAPQASTPAGSQAPATGASAPASSAPAGS